MEKQVLTSLWNKIGLVFATNTQLATLVESKQDKLTAGQGIRILNGVITNTVIPTTEGKEIVQVVVSSDTATVSGLTLNVYYNGESDPSATYTTDENGMCAFDVPYGYVYEVTFPSINGYKDIPTERHTATIIERSIEVEYEEIPLSGDDGVTGENVTVYLKSKVENTVSSILGETVTVTYDGTTTSYTSDSTGKVSFVVPYGKQYVLTAPTITDKYVNGGTVKTIIANQSARVMIFTYRRYNSGLFIVDTNGDEYRLDEWEAAVEAGTVINDDAKLIKVATSVLLANNSVFGIDIDMIRERTYGANKSWTGSRVKFDSIPENGNNPSADYYYDGLLASRLILSEGDERTIDTPAVDKCLALNFTVGEDALPGFLGSVGQWALLLANIVEIDDILLSVRPNGTYLLSTLTLDKWSSTLSGALVAYTWTTYSKSTSKDLAYIVVPFFAFGSQTVQP